MSGSIRKTFLAGLAGVALAFAAGGALADIIDTTSYDLSTGNNALSGYPTPFGTLTVVLDVDTQVATLTFTADDPAGPDRYLMIDGGSMAVNVNASSFTYTTPTATQLSGFALYSFTHTAGKTDDFGGIRFNLAWNNFDGYDHAFVTGTFTVTNTSSTAWTLATDVLTNAAIHVAVCDTTSGACNPGTKALATGYAQIGTEVLPEVPIPAAAWMFVSGLLGLIAVARRRIARKVPITGNLSPVAA